MLTPVSLSHETKKVMPFGKYKGTPLSELIEIDPSYCVWLMKNSLSRFCSDSGMTSYDEGVEEACANQDSIYAFFLDNKETLQFNYEQAKEDEYNVMQYGYDADNMW